MNGLANITDIFIDSKIWSEIMNALQEGGKGNE